MGGQSGYNNTDEIKMKKRKTKRKSRRFGRKRRGAARRGELSPVDERLKRAVGNRKGGREGGTIDYSGWKTIRS